MRTNQLSLNKVGGLDALSLIAKALALPPPKSGALERPDTRAAQGPTEVPARRHGPVEQLAHWFRNRQQRDVEARPARATDVYDLEARIRTLERNDPHPYY